ncbi:MAG: hypothetical protein CMB99_10010 [Flavobacteriaceae bacterium]|nr:hypothetical protein [Flavobacteriaceae bacterium]
MRKLIPLIVILFSISLTAQSPWTQKKGRFYTQFSYTTISGYNELFGDPDYSTEREMTDQTFQLFAEYGISDATTLIVNLPIKSIKTENLTAIGNIIPVTMSGNETALGNLQVGIKHNFSNRDWILSGQLTVEVNTGSFDQTTGIRTGYDAWSFTPLLLAGKGYGRSYLQGFIGADIRTNGYSSNFKVGGEYGRKIGKSIWLIGFLDISKSFKNGDVVLEPQNLVTGLYVNDQEFGAFGIKAIGEITNSFGVNAGFGGAFFGNNVAKQAALTFGVYQKL